MNLRILVLLLALAFAPAINALNPQPVIGAGGAAPEVVNGVSAAAAGWRGAFWLTLAAVCLLSWRCVWLRGS